MMHNDIRNYVIVELFTARGAWLVRLLKMPWNVVSFAKHSLVNQTRTLTPTCLCVNVALGWLQDRPKDRGMSCLLMMTGSPTVARWVDHTT